MPELSDSFFWNSHNNFNDYRIFFVFSISSFLLVRHDLFTLTIKSLPSSLVLYSQLSLSLISVSISINFNLTHKVVHFLGMFSFNTISHWVICKSMKIFGLISIDYALFKNLFAFSTFPFGFDVIKNVATFIIEKCCAIEIWSQKCMF